MLRTGTSCLFGALLLIGQPMSAWANDTGGSGKAGGQQAGQGAQHASAGTATRARVAGSQDAGQRRSLSASAANLLQQVDQARRAISDKDKNKAMQDIDQALTAARSLESAAGKGAKESSVHATQAGPRGGERFRGVLVPLYTELEQVSFLGPVESAKRAASKEARSGGPTAITDIDTRYSSLFLDTAGAREHLDAARKALSKGQLDQADAALAAVQSGVVFSYVETDMPLLRARENLMLARTRISEKKTADAKAALREASLALEEYGRMAGQGLAKDIKDVDDQIKGLGQKIEDKGEAAAKDVTAKIDGLWDRLTGWSI